MTGPARSWPRSSTLAVAAVYLPQLVPLVATDLLDHGHCLALYGRLFPVLVGLPAGIHVRMATNLGQPGEEVVFWGVSATATAALLLGLVLALRRGRRAGPLIAAGVALLSAGLSMAAVAILRA